MPGHAAPTTLTDHWRPCRLTIVAIAGSMVVTGCALPTPGPTPTWVATGPWSVPPVPDPEALPPLGADLLFVQADEVWRWPRDGGPLESAFKPPEGVSAIDLAASPDGSVLAIQVAYDRPDGTIASSIVVADAKQSWPLPGEVAPGGDLGPDLAVAAGGRAVWWDSVGGAGRLVTWQVGDTAPSEVARCGSRQSGRDRCDYALSADGQWVALGGAPGMAMLKLVRGAADTPLRTDAPGRPRSILSNRWVLAEALDAAGWTAWDTQSGQLVDLMGTHALAMEPAQVASFTGTPLVMERADLEGSAGPSTVGPLWPTDDDPATAEPSDVLAAWSSGPDVVLAIQSGGEHPASGVYRIPAGGDAALLVLALPSRQPEPASAWLTWSPAGHAFVFAEEESHGTAPTYATLVAANLDGGAWSLADLLAGASGLTLVGDVPTGTLP